MNAPKTTTLGNVIAPDPAWVAKHSEPALEPGLPIIDPHHHLWQRAGNDYMFHDLLADTETGHNIVGTVFVDCHSMYRKEGPPEMRCLGETEFANGVAAMAASGTYGKTRVGASIVRPPACFACCARQSRCSDSQAGRSPRPGGPNRTATRAAWATAVR